MTDNVLKHTIACLAFFMVGLHTSSGFCLNPVNVIFDTDISTDVDDVGAVAVLHALADRGDVVIHGMMVSSGDPWSGPCLDALNTWYGREKIAVGGVIAKGVSEESKYTQAIASSYPHNMEKVTDSVALYRKLLAGQPDHSITIISVGYLTNLANLLNSEADDISPLDGKELVKNKIRLLVCMGGTYPSGREWNFYQDSQSTADVVDNWPGFILFSGYERGVSVLTGAGLRNSTEPNPVRRAYELYNGISNRPSWDQLTVLIGSVNGEPLADVPNFYSVHRGINQINDDGSNEWLVQSDGPHGYVSTVISDRLLEEQIEALMSVSVEKAVKSR